MNRTTVSAALLAWATAMGAPIPEPVRELTVPVPPILGSPVGGRILGDVLAGAAACIPARQRKALADKPSPYLVKAYNVGPGTDVHCDVPWRLLDKEKDARFDLPHRGQLGLANLTADVAWRIGLGPEGGPVSFSPPRRCLDHLIDLAVQEAAIEGATARIAFLPASSSTVLAVVEMANASADRRVFLVRSVCSKPWVADRPVDRHDEGIRVTAGALQWIGRAAWAGAVIAAFQDWDRPHDAPAGTLMCTLAGDRTPAGVRALRGVGPGDLHEAAVDYRLDLPPGARDTMVLALNLYRFGPQEIETRRQIRLWPRQTPEEALAGAAIAVTDALRTDWPARIGESFRRYERMPRFSLPEERWAADMYCALELPRAATWSPQEQLATPWYTFCRPHGHDPFGWWSYGMHAHEHLATFAANITDPGLSAAFLRGHFACRQSDGSIPYGVNHRRANIHGGLVTCPLLAWESWTAYTWSGDRAFLAEAYDACGAFVRWWRSDNRTRAGAALQHWRDYVETVRDDADLPTWTATGAAERQEALDLNCYLLNEERTLAEMAAELGRPGQADSWRRLADERAETMQRQLRHEGDGLFYGRDTLHGSWARVWDISSFFPLLCGLADDSAARGIVALLSNPDGFATPWPVATLAARHMPAELRGRHHWRGANWPQMSWLVICGLKRYGCHQEASRLAERNCRMVFEGLERTSHFREYYDTLTGEPAGLTDYIWASITAAMVVDVFLGVRPTGRGLEILPALPEDWPGAAVENLAVRHARVAVEVRRSADTSTTTVALNGRPLPFVAGRGARVEWGQLPADAQILAVVPGRPAGAGAQPAPGLP